LHIIGYLAQMSRYQHFYQTMNIPKETWINPKIKIRETVNKGKSMFATEPIKTGEKVLIWGGEYINKDKVEKTKANGKLVMQWDDDLFSVEKRGKDPGYFINHSCDSNTWMSDTFTFITKRDIKAGEEVTADYALWEANEDYVSEWECKCGSPLCRKRVTGKDWRLPEIQTRYKGYFSPLINKRLKNKY